MLMDTPRPLQLLCSSGRPGELRRARLELAEAAPLSVPYVALVDSGDRLELPGVRLALRLARTGRWPYIGVAETGQHRQEMRRGVTANLLHHLQLMPPTLYLRATQAAHRLDPGVRGIEVLAHCIAAGSCSDWAWVELPGYDWQPGPTSQALALPLINWARANRLVRGRCHCFPSGKVINFGRPHEWLLA